MEGLTVEQAFAFLKTKGYFVDHMFMVDDVQNHYECTTDQAHEVLKATFRSEWMGSTINESIGDEAESMGLVKIEEDEDEDE